MPTVAITDYTFADLGIEKSILDPIAQVVGGQCRTPEALIELVQDADAVITQFAPVNAAVIESMRRAKVIVRYGSGVDNGDLQAAKRKGIPVCNVPDYCIDEVVDHTLAFIVVRRLVAFGGRVLVSDPAAAAEAISAHGAEPATLPALLATSDLVTLHCPSLPETKGMINGTTLATMRRGAIVVNLSRGDLVDPDALVGALDSGHVAGAALDVFLPEPIPAKHPILGRDNVILAPHVASVSAAAVQRPRTTAAELAVASLRGAPLPSIVNGVTTVRAVPA